MPDRYRVTKQIEVSAGHRVMHHGSKCQHLHGHRYVIKAVVDGELAAEGEESGMVMDFGFIKEVMMNRIHYYADHSTILYYQDSLLDLLWPKVIDQDHRAAPLAMVRRHVREQGMWFGDWITGRLLLIPSHPTAECLAAFWYHHVTAGIEGRSGGRARLAQIIVEETSTSVAYYPIQD